MKIVYLATIIVCFLMLVLQFFIMVVNSVREAKNTTSAYLVQTETILADNEDEEETLMASLKDDYIVLAKAVAYYLDNCPSATNDIDELNKICDLMSIDEIHIFDETGTIVSSTGAEYIGLNFDSGEQIGYFKPMLSDKTLSMCQDVTPNTSKGNLMMYAITWNEAGTQMVQIGVEPARLLEALAENEVSEVVNNISIDKKMAIIILDKGSLEVLGSTIDEYNDQNITSVISLSSKEIKKDFYNTVEFEGQSGKYFCRIGETDDYYILVLQSHGSFIDRTIESLLIITVYLVIACIVIVLIAKKLLSIRKENTEHLRIFESMSEIYYSLHLADLKENTATEYSSKNQVKAAFNADKLEATTLMIGIMHATMSDEYLERGLEFTDLTTLSSRMKDKKIISMELLGKNVGWIRMSFITFEEENGYPTKVIIATQIIDEEKKAQEALYKKSYIDEMTGCYNRRAYNEDVIEFEKNENGTEFGFISFDVNGLKTINDNLGHEAGDELICGAAECMNNAFHNHGKVYRTGGDEFIGLINADPNLMKMLCDDFDNQIKNWKGKHIDEISVSYGYVLSSEVDGKTICDISNLADKRMYEAKERYYKEKGIERRRT